MTVHDVLYRPPGTLTAREAQELIYIEFNIKPSLEKLALWRHRKQGPAWIRHGRRVFYIVPDIFRWWFHDVMLTEVPAAVQAGYPDYDFELYMEESNND